MKKERLVRYFEGIGQEAYRELKYAEADGLTIVSSWPGENRWWIDENPTFGRLKNYAVYEDIAHRLVKRSDDPNDKCYIEFPPCNGCGTNLAHKKYFSLNIDEFDETGRIWGGPSWTLCVDCFDKVKKIID